MRSSIQSASLYSNLATPSYLKHTAVRSARRAQKSRVLSICWKIHDTLKRTQPTSAAPSELQGPSISHL